MSATLIYGMATAVGAIGLVAAIAWGMNPDREQLVPSWRHGLLGVAGFGVGGMSTSFAGWPSVAAFLGAVVGAAVLVVLGTRFADGGAP